MTNKIQIRIALAINPEGQWHAYGYTDGKSWGDIMDSFDMLDDEHKRWVVAEVELPSREPEVIMGSAKTIRE